MSKRVLVWHTVAGACLLITVFSLVGTFGLEKSDQVASVVGATCAALGLLATVLAEKRARAARQDGQPWAETAPSISQSVVNSEVHGDVVLISGRTKSGTSPVEDFYATEAGTMLKRVYNKWVRDELSPEINKLDGKYLMLNIEFEDGRLITDKRPGHLLYRALEESAGRVVLTGTAGSGKTFAMIELLRILLVKEESLETASGRIPVMINIQSWSAENASMCHWLTDELSAGYGVPRNTAESWVGQGRVSLLLDGLDEVPVGDLQRFLDELAIYQQRSASFVWFVMACKSEYFENLAEYLNADLLRIQPLDAQQVESYLGRSRLHGFQQVVLSDQALLDLVRTPLALRMIDVVVSGLRDFEKASIGRSREFFVRNLYDEYADKLLERRQMWRGREAREELRSWLDWLAYSTDRKRVNEFTSSSMSFDWLPARWRGWLAEVALAIFCAILIGVVDGTLYAIAKGVEKGVTNGLAWALLFLLFILGRALEIRLGRGRSRQIARRFMRRGIIGLSGGLAIGTILWAWSSQADGVAFGIFFPIVFILSIGFIRSEPVEQMVWNFARGLHGAILTFPAGVFIGLSYGLFYWPDKFTLQAPYFMFSFWFDFRGCRRRNLWIQSSSHGRGCDSECADTSLAEACFVSFDRNWFANGAAFLALGHLRPSAT